METVIENPVIKTDEQEAKFLEAAGLADAGRDIPADLLPGSTPEAKEEPEKVEDGKQPDKTEPDPDKAKERPRDALGRFTKTEAGEDIPEDERKPVEAPVQPQTATPSEYEAKKAEKKAKEQERLDKTWENVNRQKEELERRRQELDQERQRITQQQQQPRPPQQRQFSSQELVQASRDFKARAKEALKEGNYDAFNENEALAEQAIVHAQQFYQVEQQEAQQAQQQQYQSLWVSKMAEAAKDEPDLMNPQSPLSQAMQKLLQEHGSFLYGNPDGFRYGLEFVKKQMEAGTVAELKEANKTLKAENERLTGLTAIGGSGPTTPPAKKKFEDMSPEEQEQRLMAGAQAHDEGRT